MKTAGYRSIQQEFSRLSSAYTRHSLLRAWRETAEIAAWLQPRPQTRVLDAACGTGKLGRALAPYVAQVCSLDLSAQMLLTAREFEACPRSFLPTVGDVERLPYRADSFHLLVCSYAFANFQHPLAILREFARVTRRDGRIAVIDVVAPEDRARRNYLNRLEARRGHLHTRLFSRSQFLDIFSQADLRLVATRSQLRRCHFREWVRLSPAAIHHPGHARRLRQMLVDSIDGDKAGLHPQRVKGDVVFHHTTAWFMLRQK